MKERIEKWKQMEAAGDSAATDYLKEITAQAQTEGKIQEMTEALQALMASADKHLDNVENSLNAYTMHEQMGALTEVVNLAYIARHYFGKTRQWLYQRLKRSQSQRRLHSLRLSMKSGCSWLHLHSAYDKRTSVHDSFCLTRKAHRRFPPAPGTESGDCFIELSVRGQWKFKEYEIGIFL